MLLPAKVSPNLTSSTSEVSLRAHKSLVTRVTNLNPAGLSPVRLPISPLGHVAGIMSAGPF